MSVRAEALQAWEDQEMIRRAREQADADAERQRRQDECDRAQQVLEQSDLVKWFPEQSWRIESLSSVGAAGGYSRGWGVIVCPDDDPDLHFAVESRVTALTDRQKYLAAADGEELPREIKVFVATRGVDRDTHYPYWSGIEVESVADVGAVLAEREKSA